MFQHSSQSPQRLRQNAIISDERVLPLQSKRVHRGWNIRVYIDDSVDDALRSEVIDASESFTYMARRAEDPCNNC